jgi:hypothetical protein
MSIISISFRYIVQPVRRGILQGQVRFPRPLKGEKGESRVYGELGNKTKREYGPYIMRRIANGRRSGTKLQVAETKRLFPSLDR